MAFFVTVNVLRSVRHIVQEAEKSLHKIKKCIQINSSKSMQKNMDLKYLVNTRHLY